MLGSCAEKATVAPAPAPTTAVAPSAKVEATPSVQGTLIPRDTLKRQSRRDELANIPGFLSLESLAAARQAGYQTLVSVLLEEKSFSTPKIATVLYEVLSRKEQCLADVVARELLEDVEQGDGKDFFPAPDESLVNVGANIANTLILFDATTNKIAFCNSFSGASAAHDQASAALSAPLSADATASYSLSSPFVAVSRAMRLRILPFAKSIPQSNFLSSLAVSNHSELYLGATEGVVAACSKKSEGSDSFGLLAAKTFTSPIQATAALEVAAVLCGSALAPTIQAAFAENKVNLLALVKEKVMRDPRGIRRLEEIFTVTHTGKTFDDVMFAVNELPVILLTAKGPDALQGAIRRSNPATCAANTTDLDSAPDNLTISISARYGTQVFSTNRVYRVSDLTGQGRSSVVGVVNNGPGTAVQFNFSKNATGAVLVEKYDIPADPQGDNTFSCEVKVKDESGFESSALFASSIGNAAPAGAIVKVRSPSKGVSGIYALDEPLTCELTRSATDVEQDALSVRAWLEVRKEATVRFVLVGAVNTQLASGVVLGATLSSANAPSTRNAIERNAAYRCAIETKDRFGAMETVYSTPARMTNNPVEVLTSAATNTLSSAEREALPSAVRNLPLVQAGVLCQVSLRERDGDEIWGNVALVARRPAGHRASDGVVGLLGAGAAEEEVASFDFRRDISTGLDNLQIGTPLVTLPSAERYSAFFCRITAQDGITATSVLETGLASVGNRHPRISSVPSALAARGFNVQSALQVGDSVACALPLITDDDGDAISGEVSIDNLAMLTPSPGLYAWNTQSALSTVSERLGNRAYSQNEFASAQSVVPSAIPTVLPGAAAWLVRSSAILSARYAHSSSRCRVNVTDERGAQSTLSSVAPTLTVNQIPVLSGSPSIMLETGDGSVGSRLSCRGVTATDADSDALTVDVLWSNGKKTAMLESIELTPSDARSLLSCYVAAQDSFGGRTASTASAPFAVKNSPPLGARVELAANALVSINQAVSCEIKQAATDLDGDASGYNIVLEGTPITTTSLAAFNVGPASPDFLSLGFQTLATRSLDRGSASALNPIGARLDHVLTATRQILRCRLVASDAFGAQSTSYSPSARPTTNRLPEVLLLSLQGQAPSEVELFSQGTLATSSILNQDNAFDLTKGIVVGGKVSCVAQVRDADGDALQTTIALVARSLGGTEERILKSKTYTSTGLAGLGSSSYRVSGESFRLTQDNLPPTERLSELSCRVSIDDVSEGLPGGAPAPSVLFKANLYAPVLNRAPVLSNAMTPQILQAGNLDSFRQASSPFLLLNDTIGCAPFGNLNAANLESAGIGSDVDGDSLEASVKLVRVDLQTASQSIASQTSGFTSSLTSVKNQTSYQIQAADLGRQFLCETALRDGRLALSTPPVMASAVATAQNLAPVAVGNASATIVVLSGDGAPGSVLSCATPTLVDPEGEGEVLALREWSTGALSETITVSPSNARKTISCSATGQDARGASYRSTASFVVPNAAPAGAVIAAINASGASLPRDGSPVHRGDSMTCQLTSMATDRDADALVYEVFAESMSNTNDFSSDLSLATAFSEGHSLTPLPFTIQMTKARNAYRCRAKVSDGFGGVLYIASPVVSIENRPPVVSSVTRQNAPLLVNNNVICDASAIDPDGDALSLKVKIFARTTGAITSSIANEAVDVLLAASEQTSSALVSGGVANISASVTRASLPKSQRLSEVFCQAEVADGQAIHRARTNGEFPVNRQPVVSLEPRPMAVLTVNGQTVTPLQLHEERPQVYQGETLVCTAPATLGVEDEDGDPLVVSVTLESSTTNSALVEPQTATSLSALLTQLNPIFIQDSNFTNTSLSLITLAHGVPVRSSAFFTPPAGARTAGTLYRCKLSVSDNRSAAVEQLSSPVALVNRKPFATASLVTPSNGVFAPNEAMTCQCAGSDPDGDRVTCLSKVVQLASPKNTLAQTTSPSVVDATSSVTATITRALRDGNLPLSCDSRVSDELGAVAEATISSLVVVNRAPSVHSLIGQASVPDTALARGVVPGSLPVREGMPFLCLAQVGDADGDSLVLTPSLRVLMSSGLVNTIPLGLAQVPSRTTPANSIRSQTMTSEYTTEGETVLGRGYEAMVPFGAQSVQCSLGVKDALDLSAPLSLSVLQNVIPYGVSWLMSAPLALDGTALPDTQLAVPGVYIDIPWQTRARCTAVLDPIDADLRSSVLSQSVGWRRDDSVNGNFAYVASASTPSTMAGNFSITMAHDSAQGAGKFFKCQSSLLSSGIIYKDFLSPQVVRMAALPPPTISMTGMSTEYVENTSVDLPMQVSIPTLEGVSMSCSGTLPVGLSWTEQGGRPAISGTISHDAISVLDTASHLNSAVVSAGVKRFTVTCTASVDGDASRSVTMARDLVVANVNRSPVNASANVESLGNPAAVQGSAKLIGWNQQAKCNIVATDPDLEDATLSKGGFEWFYANASNILVVDSSLANQQTITYNNIANAGRVYSCRGTLTDLSLAQVQTALAGTTVAFASRPQPVITLNAGAPYSTVSLNENQSLTAGSLRAQATLVTGENVTLSCAFGSAGIPGITMSATGLNGSAGMGQVDLLGTVGLTSVLPVGALLNGLLNVAPGQKGNYNVLCNAVYGTDSQLSSGTFTVVVTDVNATPVLAAVTAKTTPEDTLITIPLSLGDVDPILDESMRSCASSVTVTSSNPTLVAGGVLTASLPTSGINIALLGTWPACSLNILPSLNAYGQTTLTVRHTDGQSFSDRSFTLDVTPVNDAPTITSTTTSLSFPMNTSRSFAVTIADVDSTLSCATALSATSSNTTILPLANISFSGTSPNCTVSLAPATGKYGSVGLVVAVSDSFLSTALPNINVIVSPVYVTSSQTFPTVISVNENSPISAINFATGVSGAVGDSYAYACSGALPAGVSFTSTTLSGSPTYAVVTTAAVTKSFPITCSITPSGDTTRALSAAMTILVSNVNQIPAIPSSVALTPTTAYVSSTIACSASGSLDNDGDALSYQYRWYKNAVLVASQTSSSFAVTGNATKANIIQCEARAWDGAAASAWVTSSTVTIQNSPPNATTAGLSQTTGTLAWATAVTCNISPATASDPDGDTLSVTYQWAVASTSGGSYANISGQTASAITYNSATMASIGGKFIRCSVSIADNNSPMPASISATSGFLAVAAKPRPTMPAVPTKNGFEGLDIYSFYLGASIVTGETLSYSCSGLPSGLTLQAWDGAIFGYPSYSIASDATPSVNHAVSCTAVVASDATRSVSQAFTFTIANTDRIPIFSRWDCPGTVTEYAGFAIQWTALDPDGGGSFTVEAASEPLTTIKSASTITLAGSYTHNARNDTYTYRVKNSSNNTYSANVSCTIAITNVDTTPTVSTAPNVSISYTYSYNGYYAWCGGTTKRDYWSITVPATTVDLANYISALPGVTPFVELVSIAQPYNATTVSLTGSASGTTVTQAVSYYGWYSPSSAAACGLYLSYSTVTWRACTDDGCSATSPFALDW